MQRHDETEFEIIQTPGGTCYRLPRRPLRGKVPCVATGLLVVGCLLFSSSICFPILLWDLLLNFPYDSAPLLWSITFFLWGLAMVLVPLLLGLLMVGSALQLVFGRNEIKRQGDHLIRRAPFGLIRLITCRWHRSLEGIRRFTVEHDRSNLGLQLRAECSDGRTLQLAEMYPRRLLAALACQLSTDMSLSSNDDSKKPRVEFESSDANQFYERLQQPILSRAVFEEWESGCSITIPDSSLAWLKLDSDTLRVHYNDGVDVEREWSVDDISRICATGESDEYGTYWGLTIGSVSGSSVDIPAFSKAEVEWIASVLRQKLGFASQLPDALVRTADLADAVELGPNELKASDQSTL